MQNLKTKIKIFLGGLCFLIWLGFGIDGFITLAPSYALVYVHHSEKHYIAPPCASSDTSGLDVMTIKEANRLGFSPTNECRDSGAFVQNLRTLSGQFFEKIGFLPKLNSRWNTDGTWNW